MQTQSDITTKIPLDDIFVLHFGDFATFMLKDGDLWLRLNDVWHWLNDSQRNFLLRSGVGLVNMPGRSFDGEYVMYSVFIDSAPSKVKPLLQEIGKKVLAVIAQEGRPK